jgi:predicted nucleotidyltransferase
VSEITKQGVTVCIDADHRSDTTIFRIGAADDILRLLADAHETEFTIPELVEATDVTRSTVWRAVDLLDSIGAVQIRETPQRNYVSIDSDRLQKDDPILAIEQSEFHAPVRAFVNRVEAALADADDVEELLGIVVFGSVARGEADRQSDIDAFVLVDGNRTTARRVVTDVVAELRTQRFDGDRFAFEPYVESTESARRAGSKLASIFTEGITIHGSDQLDSLRKVVVADE